MQIAARVQDTGDWDPDSDHHPDVNFKNLSVKPFGSSEQHEEVRNNRKTAPFTMTFTLSNGDAVTYTGDQCNSWNNAQVEAELSGPAASRYMLLQNSGESRDNYRNNLALIERMDMTNWMSRVSDNTLFSRLLIPGPTNPAPGREIKYPFARIFP